MELCLTWFRQWIADKNKITSSLPFQTILKNLLLQSCFFSPQNVQFFKASKQVYTFLALFCEVEKNLKMDGICSNISIMDEQFSPTFFGTWIDANWMQKKTPNHRLNLRLPHRIVEFIVCLGVVFDTPFWTAGEEETMNIQDDKFTLWRETLFCCCVTYVIIFYPQCPNNSKKGSSFLRHFGITHNCFR